MAGLTALAPLSLELDGCQIAECRVNALGLVHHVDEVPQIGARLADIGILVQLHLFFFDRAHDPLDVGIIGGRTLGRHTDLDPGGLQALHVAGSCVLDALI